MCPICGCGIEGHSQDHPHGPRGIVEAARVANNDGLARALRDRFTRDAITTFNLIGTPGAGKTTLLERTIRELGRDMPVAVLEGDQATDHDARRIAATGCRVVQINTGAGCHLDAPMIEAGLARLEPQRGTLLFVENVGNLVCPALFDLGERAKIVVVSVTEGEDKPLKYPHVFEAATAMVVTKIDLVPHLAVDVARYIANARKINSRLVVFPIAAARGEGLDEWCAWLRNQIANRDAPRGAP